MQTLKDCRYEAMVAILDRFTVAGGIDLALAKETSLCDGQSQINYTFYTSSGCRFQATLYHYNEGGVLQPFFGLWLIMCPLNTVTDQHAVLNYLLVDNCDMPSPLKFVLVNGSIAVCIRLKVSEVSPEYVEQLILQSLDVANQVVKILVEKHGATAVAEMPVESRMVQ